MGLTSINIGRRQLANELADIMLHVVPELEKQTGSEIRIYVEKHGFKLEFITRTGRLQRLVSYQNYMLVGSGIIGRALREMAAFVKTGIPDDKYENG